MFFPQSYPQKMGITLEGINSAPVTESDKERWLGSVSEVGAKKNVDS